MLAILIFFIIHSIFTIEDLILDVIAFIFRLKPKYLNEIVWKEMIDVPEKPIAILVANWKEAGVIERMIIGNLNQIQYRNFHFFIGVYPNDLETLEAAKMVESRFPHNVHVIVNSVEGPTSKGQMLNQIVHGILRLESILKKRFEVFLLHDSEDILHPRSLKVINYEIEKTDFLQTPVFSFKRDFSKWVGSTYVDEFAELHTKDLLVRQFLGAAVPSAGVGTALNRSLVEKLLRFNEGLLLKEDSLTEDYILGMTSSELGFKTSFCCYRYNDDKAESQIIATREYFPESLGTAIRQKSRWILGIVFQGILFIEWKGSLFHKYFLYRDRRGPIVNLFSMFSLFLTLYFIYLHYFLKQDPDYFYYDWFQWGFVFSTLGLVNRLFHRMVSVIRVNGISLEIFQIPLRWPLGVLVNVMATFRALNQFQRFLFFNEPLKWIKTTHVLPENFGLESIDADKSVLDKEKSKISEV